MVVMSFPELRQKKQELSGRLLIGIANANGEIVNLTGLDDPRPGFCDEWNSFGGDFRAYPISDDIDLAKPIRREE